MSVSPAMVIPESSHIGYQIDVLKVFCGNFRCIFLHQVFEERKKQRFFFLCQGVNLYDLYYACYVELGISETDHSALRICKWVYLKHTLWFCL